MSGLTRVRIRCFLLTGLFIALLGLVQGGCGVDENQTETLDLPVKRKQMVLAFDQPVEHLEFYPSGNGERLAVTREFSSPSLLYVDGEQADETSGGFVDFEWAPGSEHYKYEKIYQDHEKRLYTDSYQMSDRFDSYRGFTWSPDGKHFFFIGEMDNEREAIVIDGDVVKVVDEVEEWEWYRDRFLISAIVDGKAYLFHGKQSKRGPFKEIHHIRVSTNQKHALVPVTKGEGESYYLYDEEKFGPYQFGLAVGGQLSAGGDHWFGSAEKPDTDKKVMNVDGTEYGPFRRISWRTFSPEGGNVAFIAERESGEDVLYQDGDVKDQAKKLSGLVYTADGNDLIYGKGDGEQMSIVGAKHDSRTYDHIIGIHVQSDGTSWGYTAKRDGSYFIVVNDREYGPYDFPPIHMYFSSGGRHFNLAPHSRDSDEEYVIVDGDKFTYEGSVWPVKEYVTEKPSSVNGYVIFGPDDETFYYCVLSVGGPGDADRIYRNGKPWIKADKVRKAWVSKKKQWIGFLYERGMKDVLRIGERTFSAADIDGFTFSENGSDYAVRLDGMHQQQIIYNGKEVLSAPNVSSPTFNDGHLEVVAQEDKALHRLTFDISD